MASKTDLTQLGEVVSTDVLIIGGGIAGLVAAIKASQARPAVSVLVVDKATPGYAGQGPLVGGGTEIITEGQLDAWLKWKVESGGYLNDQDYAYAIGKDTYKVQLEMADWGAPFERDKSGKLLIRSSGPHRSGVQWPSPPAMMQFLRGKAVSEGAKMLKRIMVVELLTEGERVAGAVGFSMDSGRFYILKAKATILANGACLYRYRSRFTSTSGEGVAMAYNLGAEMRCAEFANTAAPTFKDTLLGGHGASGREFENAKGENIREKYGIPIEEGTPFEKIILAMYKEITEGRGPIYSPAGRRGQRGHEKKIMERLGITLDRKIEFVIAQSARQGPIKVDLQCRTTLPGLWAVGDISMGGSAFYGALATNSHGGTGIAVAEVTGYRAGLDTSDFASQTAVPEIDAAEVSKLKEQIYAPLQRTQGFDPNEVIYQVQEAIMPVKYNIFRSGERMQEALSMIEKVKEKLPALRAKDPHYLAKCYEAKSMALCAEMTYRPALMRKESRSSHMRDDYPHQDDQNWLKWIMIKKEKHKMKLWTEPVPIDTYKIKLPRKKA